MDRVRRLFPFLLFFPVGCTTLLGNDYTFEEAPGSAGQSGASSGSAGASAGNAGDGTGGAGMSGFSGQGGLSGASAQSGAAGAPGGAGQGGAAGQGWVPTAVKVFPEGETDALPGRQARQGMGGVVVRLEGAAPEGELTSKVGTLGASAKRVGEAIEILVHVNHGAPLGGVPIELAVGGVDIAGLGNLEVTAISAAPQGDDDKGKGTPLSPLRSLSRAVTLASKDDQISLAEGSYGPSQTGEIMPVKLPDGVEVRGQGLVVLQGDPAKDLLEIPGSATVRSVLLSGGKRGVIVGPSTFKEVLLEDVELDGFMEQGVSVLGAPAVTLLRSSLGSVRRCKIKNTGEEAMSAQGAALIALQDCEIHAGKTHAISADGTELLSLVDTALIGQGKDGPPRHGLHLSGVKSLEIERGSIENHWIGIFAISTNATLSATSFSDNFFMNNGVPDGFAIDPCGGTWLLKEVKVSNSPYGITVFNSQNDISCSGIDMTIRDSSFDTCAVNAISFLPSGANLLLQKSSITKSAAYANVAAVGISSAGSKLRMEDSSVVGASGYGVFVTEGAKLELAGTTPGACLVKGSGADGVLLFKDGYEATIDGCTIEGSGWSGVSAGSVEDGPPVAYGGSLKISNSVLRDNNQSKNPNRAGVAARQIGPVFIENTLLDNNHLHGLLLHPESSGVVSITGGAITGSSGNGITARSTGSLSLQGLLLGKSGQGNQGHGLLIDNVSPLTIKVRGSTLAGNQLSALAVLSDQASVDLGNSKEPGNNSLQGNVLANLGKTPADSAFAELLDQRSSAGPPILVRGLDVDGVPFLTTPQTLSGPLAQGSFGHRFGLRVTGPGAVQSF